MKQIPNLKTTDFHFGNYRFWINFSNYLILAKELYAHFLIIEKTDDSCSSYSPVSPDAMDWRTLFPAFFPEKDDNGEHTVCKTSRVEFADIGCGYGGLLGTHVLTLTNRLHVVMHL